MFIIHHIDNISYLAWPKTLGMLSHLFSRISPGSRVLSQELVSWPVFPLECFGVQATGSHWFTTFLHRQNTVGLKAMGTCPNFCKFEKMQCMPRVDDWWCFSLPGWSDQKGFQPWHTLMRSQSLPHKFRLWRWAPGCNPDFSSLMVTSCPVSFPSWVIPFESERV